MKLKALGSFCRRMGVGLRAGVDILRIIETETRTGDSRHRVIMKTVDVSLRSGKSLAGAMLEQKKYFPPLLIQLVHASEVAGRMDQLFLNMAEYYEDLLKTRNHFFSQISWPVIQLILAVFVIGAVILIQGLLASSPNGPAYDASGLGLSGVNGFLLYCTCVFIIAAFVGTIILGVWKNWLNCHRLLMPLVQRIPNLGTALTTLGLSRLSMTLSMLLNAGVEARRSLKQAFLSTGNHYFISGMDGALAAIERGNSFGDAFDAAGVFPNEFLEAVRLGELSGTETESLDHLAIQYRERSKAALSMLAMIASGAIWLSVMFIIGFMVIKLGLQYVNLLNNAGTI